MKGYIYTITNKENGKQYIGKTFDLNKRIYDHFWDLSKNRHHSVELQRAYNKYGRDAFEVSYKEYEIDSAQDLAVLEIKAIAEADSFNNGYNETMGGEGHQLVIDWKNRVLIYQILKRYDGVARQIAQFFKCDHTVINQIRNNPIYEKEPFSEEDLKYLIKQLNLSDNNLVENYVPHNTRKLNKESCLEILSIIYNLTGFEKTLCNIFNIDSKLTYRLKQKTIYKEYIEEYESLTEEEQKKLMNDTLKKYNLNSVRMERIRARTKNALTQEQVDYILDNLNTKTGVQIAKDLNISRDRVSGIKNRKYYLDLIEDYEKRHSNN